MLSTTAEYQATDLILNRPLPTGLDRLVYTCSGWCKRRMNPTPGLAGQAEVLLEKAEPLKRLTLGKLKNELRGCRERIRRERGAPGQAVIQAIPYLVEAADRMVGLRPYREQIMGMLALQGPHITEMATGEGKTLTIALAGITAGWTGFPCHIITANDYLAQRDATTMGPLYEFAGLQVAPVLRDMEPQPRMQAYRSDVVYTTSKEIVADFLRDRLRLRRLHPSVFRINRSLVSHGVAPSRQLLQKGIHTAIVDEADNLLIDEAITPLIISQRQSNESLVNAIRVADQLAQNLVEGLDYTRDDKRRNVDLKPGLQERIAEERLTLDSFYRESGWLEELVQKALIARLYFHRNRQYVIEREEVVIVDDFTGRLMQGRSWKQGLQQAIEAKEQLPVTDPSESVTSLSFQRFFRFFRRLSGITGTAAEAAPEFWNVYGLSFIHIPRHEPLRRIDHPPQVYPTLEEKWEAVAREIEAVHQSGRPVLVGTRTIMDSEFLSGKLLGLGLAHQLLNASREREEARIISMAGYQDGITIATNMAGRGTDIKLRDEVAKLGGLHVVATEINESQRIDRQLYGRAGRQGDPGSSSTFISLDDQLLKEKLPLVRSFLKSVYKTRNPALEPLVRAAVRMAQIRAVRQARTQRQSVTRRDSWLEETFAMSGLELGN